jgi:Flp pilus assembly pilin Flp
MERLKAALIRLARTSDGQDLVEYGLLAALIALVAFAAVRMVGNTIYDVFWSGIGQVV